MTVAGVMVLHSRLYTPFDFLEQGKRAEFVPSPCQFPHAIHGRCRRGSNIEVACGNKFGACVNINLQTADRIEVRGRGYEMMQRVRRSVCEAGGMLAKESAAHDVGAGGDNFGTQRGAFSERAAVFPGVFEARQWNPQCNDFVWHVGNDDVFRPAVEVASEPAGGIPNFASSLLLSTINGCMIVVHTLVCTCDL